MSPAEVVLVSGPPCAGKTSHVAQHAQPGDVVLDQDALGPARFAEELEALPGRSCARAWVIRCCPGPRARDAYALRIGATRRVHLRPPEHVLMIRASARTHPSTHRAAVREWIKREAEDRIGAVSSPAPRVLAWWT